MNKILITGNTGSGKTTVSGAIGRAFNIPVYSLDSVVWTSGWTKASAVERRKETEKIISNQSWVVDGVCSRTLKAADTIVVLDLPLGVCLANIIKRFIKNGPGTRQGLPKQCPEIIGVFKALKLAFIYQRQTRPKILGLIEECPPSKKIVVIRARQEISSILLALD